jgi:hypothetical protein
MSLGSKNILDAQYLAVNRLARKCIKGLSLICSHGRGLRAPTPLKGSIILGGQVFELAFSMNSKKSLLEGRTFWPFGGN